MKVVIAVGMLSAGLSAEETAVTEKIEGGLIHAKQEGRYQVVSKLPEKADGFDQAFDYAKPFALFRLANVSTQQDGIDAANVEEVCTSGTSLGGVFGFETASLYGVNLRLGAYTSQKLNSLNPDDPQKQNRDLFDAAGDSYAYIGEAALGYESGLFQANAGRIRIDTPYADSDDIRISPNSFEGVWSHVDLGHAWESELFVLTRWAGFDSGEDQDVFKPLVEGGYGLAGGSLSYFINEDNVLSLWYYNVDKESDIVYVEGSGQIDFTEEIHMEWGLQGAHIQERSDSGVGGDVIGTMLIADFDYVYFGGAVNYVYQDANMSVTDGFGGGPYYTSLDEQTIGAFSELVPGEAFRVFRLALGFDLTRAGIDQLNLEFAHGHFFFDEHVQEVKESDVALTYKMTERWYFETIYSQIDFVNIDYTDAGSHELRDFQRLVTRLDYSF